MDAAASQHRFAVIFDLHYCLDRPGVFPAGAAEVDDKPRYVWMRQQLFPALIEELNGHRPEWVVCTGDIVEGGSSDHELLRRELTEVFDRFSSARLPLLNALGTHEPRSLYRQIALPRMSQTLGRTLATEYFAVDFPWARLVLIDYQRLTPDGEQAQWLKEQLLTAPADRPLLVCGHAPLANFARPFFSPPAMQASLSQAFNLRAPLIYFCGHTHNQTLSRHPCGGGNASRTAGSQSAPTRSPCGGARFTQIKGSTVGFPEAPAEPLEQRHRLLLDDGDEFFWGVPEDAVPGYWVFDLEGEALRGRWFGLRRGLLGEAVFPIDGSAPEIITSPKLEIQWLRCRDLPLVRAAWVEAFAAGDNDGGLRVHLNGHLLGFLPPNGSYAARRSLPLTKDALRSLAPENELKVRADDIESLLFGAARLVAHTFDGRRLVTRVPEALFVSGGFARRAANHPLFHVVGPGEPLRLTLALAT